MTIYEIAMRNYAIFSIIENFITIKIVFLGD